MKPKKRQSLDEILQSTSDTLFPARMGRKKVRINSRDVEGDTPLHVMASRNDIYAAKLLIEAGADVNAVGDMGETPLHVAIRNENVRVSSVLIEAGARLDIRSEFGQTADEMLEASSREFRRLRKP